jgi:hypothetical protein
VTRALTFLTVLALVAGVLAAVWLADWRWLVTGACTFVVLGTAGGVLAGRSS